MMATLILALLTGALASLVLTPLTIRLAHHFNFVDRPNGAHKSHGREVALGGGVAVLLSFLIAVLVAYLSSAGHFNSDHGYRFVLTYLPACVVITLVGLIDDRFRLRGRHKLLGQLAAAAILVGGGTVIQSVSLFGYRWELGILAVPVSLFWICGAINAINLLDGLDGFASTVGIVLLGTLAVLGVLQGQPVAALVALSLAGSLAAFLVFNRPPAAIFLGDAGSMLIGLAIGQLAIQTSRVSGNLICLAAPLAVLAVPMLDSAAAIVRRKLTGRSIYATDRGHLHHCLMAKLNSNVAVLAVVAVCCLGTCAGAVLSVIRQNDAFAILTVIALAGTLVLTNIFGLAEIQLLVNCLRSWIPSIDARRGGRSRPRERRVRLQGTRQWDLLWNSLVESGERLQLRQIDLVVCVPSSQEGYHASWQWPEKWDPHEVWKTEIPLQMRNLVVGRLTLVGGYDQQGSACRKIDQLMQAIHPIESMLTELAEPKVDSLTPTTTPAGHPVSPFVLPVTGAQP